MHTATSPVHFEEIVPPRPESFGAHDACLDGIGGVFFGTDGTLFVWNLALPHDLHGRHHINVLELAAHVMQLFVCTPLLPALMHTLDGMDNTVAMSWIRKGSVANVDAILDLLLWRAAIVAASHTVSSVAFVRGMFNVMSDAASRLTHLTPAQLCAHFNAHFPQKKYWTYVPLTFNSVASLTTLLSGTRSTKAWFPVPVERCAPTGASGRHFAAPSDSPPLLRESEIPSRFFSCLGIESAQANSPFAEEKYESVW